MNQVFKLITGEIIFGAAEAITVAEDRQEILIKKPFTTHDLGNGTGGMKPYLVDVMGNAPAAIQVHPMNVIWTVPLDEFKEFNTAYIEATSDIEIASAPNKPTGTYNY